jgi:hypothetical protein
MLSGFLSANGHVTGGALATAVSRAGGLEIAPVALRLTLLGRACGVNLLQRDEEGKQFLGQLHECMITD